MPGKAVNPKISVIIPSYNQGVFLSSTLDSITSQDYSNWEVIIQDGGSTDDSSKIIRSFAQKYPQKTKWVSAKDKGQVDAINQGLKKATGDIITYINSDDYYLSGAFTSVAALITNQRPWLVGDCRVTSGRLNWTFALKHLMPIDRFPSLMLLFNWINQPAVFLSRSLVDKVGEFDTAYHYAFDYEYWLRCLKIARPFRLHYPLAVFRIHDLSKGNTGYTRQFSEDYAVASRYTKNPLILFFHKVLQAVTISLYRLLK